MDKVAYYEEMILSDVLEKEASRAGDRYVKKILDVEKATGARYMLPANDRQAYHMDGLFQANKLRKKLIKNPEVNVGYIGDINTLKQDFGSKLHPTYNTGISRKSNNLDSKYQQLLRKQQNKTSLAPTKAKQMIDSKYPELKGATFN